MNLKQAANFFRYTWVDGFDGVAWVPNALRVTLMPFDRFISDREWGAKFRHMLVDPDTDVLDSYSALRTGNGQIYLVGVRVQDFRDDPYSNVYKVHVANYTGNVVRMNQTKAASGAVKEVLREVVGTYFCDTELITFLSSRETPSVKYGDSHVILPRGLNITTADEIEVGADTYQVDLVSSIHGLTYCRGVRKPTP